MSSDTKLTQIGMCSQCGAGPFTNLGLIMHAKAYHQGHGATCSSVLYISDPPARCDCGAEEPKPFPAKPAAAPLPDTAEAKTVLANVQEILLDEDYLFAAEGLRVVYGALDALTSRVAELESGNSDVQCICTTGVWCANEREKLTARAEAAEAECAALEAERERVMAWAKGRCECCEHANAAGQGIPHVSRICRECCRAETYVNWTPTKEWEVKP